MKLVARTLIFTVAMLVAAGVAPAQPSSKATFTDAAHAGPDFRLQGEYLGSISRDGSVPQSYGLQIVALGGGKFDGVLYSGGLPGSGWNRRTKLNLSGNVHGGSLQLSGEAVQIRVQDSVAVAIDNGGREIGRLQRVMRQSPTLGLQPPAGATILFSGGPTDKLQKPKITPDGLLMAGVLTNDPVDAFRLHIEFRTPFMPQARGQARGNSGVYIQQRYEVQILDSFGLEGIENECGGLYRQQKPDVNMCLPPLAWQTYDIWFTPPRFNPDGKKQANAGISVVHNGVPIHVHRELTAKTGGGKPEGPEPFPINLQDHGNPVMFRNIWIVPGCGDANFIEPAFVAQHSTSRPTETCVVRQPRCRSRHWR